MQSVAVINKSTVLTDAQVQAAIPAFQTQVSRDFAPVWGIDASPVFVAKDATIPAGSWELIVLDDSDQAGALGYHQLQDGVPRGFVFARTDVQAGLQWTVTFSHELLEMLADPWVMATALVEGPHKFFGTTGHLLALEVSDACEADPFAYKIGDVLVSDFVTPAWFGAQLPAGGKYDFCGHCSAPFQLLQGGYIGIYDFRGGMGWTQKTAAGGQLAAHEIPVGSRRERRARRGAGAN